MVNKSPVGYEVELERAVDMVVKLSLTQDRMVQDLAVWRGESSRSVRNYYGIGEKT